VFPGALFAVLGMRLQYWTLREGDAHSNVIRVLHLKARHGYCMSFLNSRNVI
jgi:hypothetical protein